MRYIVLTTKHHDGFCLWDSALTDYDIMSTPFARDVVAELSAACRSEGIVFCAYHSICDWRHPDYPLGSPGGKTRKPDARMDRYVDYLKGLLTELLTKYGPLGILWFDGEWEEPWTEELGRDLYRYCRTLQPSLIINNRVAKARQGMTGTSASGHFSGDYDTPEQEVGRFQTDRPWESCITLCQQWAWKPDDAMKSLEACIGVLVNCAGGDGNLLLNVGPMPSGAIEPRQTRRLAEIGRWFESNEASIRGTRGGPWRPGEWGASTHRDRDIYLHVLSPPADGVVRLAPIPRRIVRAERLDGTKVDVIATASGLAVHLPHERDDRHRYSPDTRRGAQLQRPQRPPLKPPTHMRLTFLILTVMLSAALPAFADPIAVSRTNPHYFARNGKPIVLVSSDHHYGAVIDLDFDYVAFLDTLAANGLNLTRIYPGACSSLRTSTRPAIRLVRCLAAICCPGRGRRRQARIRVLRRPDNRR